MDHTRATELHIFLQSNFPVHTLATKEQIKILNYTSFATHI